MLTPRQETQRKLWAIVGAHASGDDIWPLLLNGFTTDEARTVAYELPRRFEELLLAAGLEPSDMEPVLDYCKAKLAEFAADDPRIAAPSDPADSDDLRRAAKGLIDPANWPDEDGNGERSAPL
jgi:hypothetical protein